MTQKTYFPWAFVLSLGGVLFAGYLAGHKLFTKTCAFGESCPVVFGQPACYFGFMLFAVLAIATGSGLFSKKETVRAMALKVATLFSLLGILFAGSLTVGEMVPWFTSGIHLYNLGLPTCSYGLVFFTAIFVLSALAMKKTAVPPAAMPPTGEIKQ